MATPFRVRVVGEQAPDLEEVGRAVAVLFPEATVQLQALPSGVWRHVQGKDSGAVLEAVKGLAEGARGVYWSINPFTPSKVIQDGQPRAVHVPDVDRRRWLLIDVDRKKTDETKESNATQAEKHDASAVTTAIWRYLSAAGWPCPVLVDSGNGWHLYYRVDLPNVPASQKLVRAILYALGDRFDTDRANVDRSCHNANRISKMPGTWARKGPHSEERPHRLAHLVHVPEEIRTVTAELIQQTIDGLATTPTAGPAIPVKVPPRPFCSAADVQRRAIGYIARIPGGIAGQHGSNPTLWAARVAVFGFDLGPDVGFRLLWDHYNPRCDPAWSEKELLHKCQSADTAPFDKVRGWLLDENRGSNGNGMPGNGHGCPVDGQPMTGTEIILAYLRERYRPVFRDGNAIRCAEGREVLMAEACAVPTSALIEQLQQATNAPCYRGGSVNLNALPGFFRTWSRVAWGDLLASLLDEAQSPDCDAAKEEFVRLVREALLVPVVLHEANGDERGTVQTQRRPLAHWCKMFARLGPWRDIRDLACWTRFVDGGLENSVLQIAMRHELFSQTGGDRKLRLMGPRKFGSLAAKYGVGQSSRKERPHGLSALLLADSFVAELICTMTGEEDTWTETAHA